MSPEDIADSTGKKIDDSPRGIQNSVQTVLPPHPRDVTRKSNTFESAIMSMLSSAGCGSLSDVIGDWKVSLKSFASLMKVGRGRERGGV